jgi:hypothetical protein
MNQTTASLARLDAMLAGLWDAATSGDGRAVAAVLNIEERRAAVLAQREPEPGTAVDEFTRRLAERRQAAPAARNPT